MFCNKQEYMRLNRFKDLKNQNNKLEYNNLVIAIYLSIIVNINIIFYL